LFHIIRYDPFGKIMRLEIEFREDHSRAPDHTHTQQLLFIVLVSIVKVMPNRRAALGSVSFHGVLSRFMPSSLAILDFSDQREKIGLSRTTRTGLWTQGSTDYSTANDLTEPTLPSLCWFGTLRYFAGEFGWSGLRAKLGSVTIVNS
jgi:hypothetical protein